MLAMGKWEQIIALQRTRDEVFDASSHLGRPVHLLDHQPQSHQSKVSIKPIIRSQSLYILNTRIIGLETFLFDKLSFAGDCSTKRSHERACVCDQGGEGERANAAPVHSVGGG